MATVQKRSRQSRAYDMLEAQLKSGVKTEKKTKDVKVPLTDSDKRRIEKDVRSSSNSSKTRISCSIRNEKPTTQWMHQ